MKLSEQYHVGEHYRVWSNRVMGVPVYFQITKVGTKLLHGRFMYGGVEWDGAIVPARIVSKE